MSALILLLIVFVICSAATLEARKLWVASAGNDVSGDGSTLKPYATIAFALSKTSVSVRDTVMVKPGTYPGGMTFPTYPVVLMSQRGANSTVIDGQRIHNTIAFGSGVSANTILDGFTVKNGNPHGIYIVGVKGAVGPGESSPEIRNCIISQNVNPDGESGAGLFLQSSRSSIHDCKIVDDTGSYAGGAIFATGSSLQIWNNEISGNIVTGAETGSGAGITIYGEFDTTLTTLIQNNLIIDNVSSYYGGGVYINSAKVALLNNLILNDTAVYGGGIYIQYGINPRIQNNIIVSNANEGIDCSDIGSAVIPLIISNCFYNNSPATQNQPICTIDASNLSVDPQFVDPASGNYRLKPTSPLINKGLTLPAIAKTLDKDGLPRSVGLPDMGPYERSACNLTANFGVPATICKDGITTFQELSTGYFYLSIWDYGNGAVDTFTNSQAIVPATSYAAVGNFSVTHTVICPYDTFDVKTIIVNVTDKPKMSIRATQAGGCVPLVTGFESDTTYHQFDRWSFGDGTNYTGFIPPNHQYSTAGVYTVKLVSSNACGTDSAAITVTASNVPTASFVADTTRGSAPFSVNFTGSGTNSPSTWSWSFGDGETSTDQSPGHIYITPGLYDVSLRAINDCGAGPIYTRSSYIRVYGFDLKLSSADTTNPLSRNYQVRIDSLYGLFNRKIVLSTNISPSPRRGTLSAHTSRDSANLFDNFAVPVTLSPDLAAGTYQLAVIGKSISNTPADTLYIPVVSRPNPLIQISPTALDFDSVQIDTVKVDSVKVSNVSFFGDNLNLQIQSVSSTDTEFIPLETSWPPLLPNGSVYVHVKFKPATLGPKTAFLTITSDDPANPNLLVQMDAVSIPERRPPTVVSTSPANNAGNVLIGSPVVLDMSELVDPTSFSTGSLSVRSKKKNSEVAGTAQLLGQLHVQFTADSQLPSNDTITVKLLGTIRDRAGNSLDANGDGIGTGSPTDDYTFRFFTGPGVFPGDCNNDGVVNENDVLPLGVYFGLTGPHRDSLGEGNSWGEKQAYSWSVPKATYADADGDGVVDANDLLVIALNWGQSHADASPIFSGDFDYSGYAARLAKLRPVIEGLSDGPVREKMLQVLSSYTVSNDLPTKFELLQNHPNPFNPTTEIEYGIASPRAVKLTIHNIIGQTVKVLVDGFEDVGYKHVIWDGRDQNGREVSSGVYFYKIEAGDFVEVRKMLKLQ